MRNGGRRNAGAPPPWVRRGGQGHRTKARNSAGQGLILHGNRQQPHFRGRVEQDWHVGAPREARITAKRPFSLESSGTFGYERSLRLDPIRNPG